MVSSAAVSVQPAARARAHEGIAVVSYVPPHFNRLRISQQLRQQRAMFRKKGSSSSSGGVVWLGLPRKAVKEEEGAGGQGNPYKSKLGGRPVRGFIQHCSTD